MSSGGASYASTAEWTPGTRDLINAAISGITITPVQPISPNKYGPLVNVGDVTGLGGDVSSVQSIVQSAMSSCQGSASSLLAQLEAALNALAAVTAAIDVDTWDGPDVLTPFPIISWDPYLVGDVPGPDTPPGPQPINLIDVPGVDVSDAPPFTGVFPELDFSGEPIHSEIPQPGDVPILTSPTIPGSPNIVLPDPPVLDEIIIPTPEDFSIPPFVATPPVFESEEPTGFYFEEGVYSSGLYDVLVAKLISDLESSSSGIDPDVEQALYDRSVAKLNTELSRQQQDTENYFASKNFFLPSGALSGRLLEIQDKAGQAHTDILNDIIVQRSNLVQQNIQTLVNASVQLEGLLRQAYDNVQQREFAKQQAVAESAMALFNARLEKYKAEITAYGVEAEVYKSLIQGEIAKVELFKARIEGAKVSAQVQELLIKIYLAELDGVKSMVEIYKTQMESAKIFSDVEIAKITAFKAEVEAYIARVNAQAADWQGYATKAQAQGIKASAFGEQVKQYQTEVQAWSTIAGTEVEKARLTIEDNNSRINKLTADVQKYQQDVAFNLGKAQSLVGIEDLRIRASGVHIDGESKKVESTAREEALKLEQAKVESGEKVARMQGKIQVQVEEFRVTVEKMRAMAQAISQAAASALNTFSASASLGGNASKSVSGNLSVGSSFSANESISAGQSLGNNMSSGVNLSANANDSMSFSSAQSQSVNQNTNQSTSHSTNRNNNISQSTSESTSHNNNINESTSQSTNHNNSITHSTSEATSQSNTISNNTNMNRSRSEGKSENWFYYPE